MSTEADVRAGRWRLRAGRPALPAVILAVLVTAWCVAAHGYTSPLPSVARNLAFGLFLVAGALRLGRWRLAGEPVAARAGVALLLLGAAIPVAKLIGPLLHEAEPAAQNAPSSHAVFLLAGLALLLPGTNWARQTASRPVPASYAAAVFAAGAALLATIICASALVTPATRHVITFGVAGAAAIGWLVLAGRRLRVLSAPMRGWCAVAAALLAAAELVRGWVVAGGVPAAGGLPPGLELAAASVIVVTAIVELRDAYRADNASALDLSRMLIRVQDQLAEVERVQRERLHDARSAVVGVMGASELLAVPLPKQDADLLRHLVMDELHRLESVLETAGPEPITAFDLTATLTPVIALHDLTGPPIQVQLGSLRVLGRPKATATVLDNLLRNARLHAPGATVAVRAIYGGPAVAVVVEDDGPGIPEAERDLVLQPGIRGSTACGSGEGVGLHSCLVAMHAQGGNLHVRPRVGGGTRVVFILPTAMEPSGVLAS